MFTRLRITAAVTVVVLAVVGTALASPPNGQTVTPLARGSAGKLNVQHNLISLKSRYGADVAVADVKIPVGGHTGWHHHPGLVIVAVQAGTVTRYDHHCHGETYTAGQVFIEEENTPSIVRNRGAEQAHILATYIVPTSGGPTPTPTRIEDPVPSCDVT
jgi:quercetin dioxygenase-like cupin family protein